MIDVRELMIGSIVTDEFYDSFKTLITVDSINDKGINLIIQDDGNYTECAETWIGAERSFEELFGVHLSEEILIKCGFEKGKFGSYFITLANGFSKLTYWRDEKAIELNNTSGTKWGHVYCEYLHELQQLYKILTKQELEIKL